jgi:hypothetical protein
MYSRQQIPALYNALAAYQAQPEKDPYANLMLQPFGTNESLGAMLNMVYLKPEESPAAFDPFYDIPTVSDATKLQTLNEMISGQIVPGLPRQVLSPLQTLLPFTDRLQMGLALYELHSIRRNLRKDKFNHRDSARSFPAQSVDRRHTRPWLPAHIIQPCTGRPRPRWQRFGPRQGEPDLDGARYRLVERRGRCHCSQCNTLATGKDRESDQSE